MLHLVDLDGSLRTPDGVAASLLLGSAPQSADLKKRDTAPIAGKPFAPPSDGIPDWQDIPTIWVETDPVSW